LPVSGEWIAIEGMQITHGEYVGMLDGGIDVVSGEEA
jgi:hypothetical protein